MLEVVRIAGFIRIYEEDINGPLDADDSFVSIALYHSDKMFDTSPFEVLSG
jgi:hypothetical protein